jgi:hypothetical protein
MHCAWRGRVARGEPAQRRELRDLRAARRGADAREELGDRQDAAAADEAVDLHEVREERDREDEREPAQEEPAREEVRRLRGNGDAAVHGVGG